MTFLLDAFRRRFGPAVFCRTPLQAIFSGRFHRTLLQDAFTGRLNTTFLHDAFRGRLKRMFRGGCLCGLVFALMQLHFQTPTHTATCATMQKCSRAICLFASWRCRYEAYCNTRVCKNIKQLQQMKKRSRAIRLFESWRCRYETYCNIRVCMDTKHLTWQSQDVKG